MNYAGLIMLSVMLLPSLSTALTNTCVAGGCSGQLCLEKGQNIASTCEWTESYRCYSSVGRCERQADGKCGWTPTPELARCLENAKTLRPPELQAPEVQ